MADRLQTERIRAGRTGGSMPGYHVTAAGWAAVELSATFGVPPKVDTAQALTDAGLDGRVNPADVVAFLYPTRAAATAYGEANRRHHGYPTIARTFHPDGTVTGIVAVWPTAIPTAV